MADSYDVGGCRFIVGSIGRTDDDVVLFIIQSVVIADHDVRLVLINTVTSYTVVGTNDVVIFAVSQGILEAIDIVVLRRGAFSICIIAAGDLIAHADDLSHVGFVNRVAAAHDHDLGTTLRNSSL